MSAIQYTIRNIPGPVDKVLRAKAKKLGKSFNQTVVDSLAQATGAHERPVRHDLDWFVGGKMLDDATFDRLAKEQRKIDPKLWQ